MNYLNSQHKNITFTSELEQNGKLPFLDIEVERQDHSFGTAIYRKKTFTGLLTKFSSAIPLQYKRNLISTLVTRAYRISSSFEKLHKEFTLISNILFANGFPRKFTDTYIGKQLSKLHNHLPPVQVPTVTRGRVYIPITYTGRHSINIRRQLGKLLRQFYPQLNFRFIFKPQKTISQHFRFKNRIPDGLQSCVIYKYTCLACQSEYIGRTERQLGIRISEHLGKSFRTNRPLSKPPYSAIQEHSETHNHLIYRNQFNILASTRFSTDLDIMEALYTFRLHPKIAKHERPAQLLCFSE